MGIQSRKYNTATDVKIDSNINDMVGFIGRLRSAEFPLEIDRHFNTSDNNSLLQAKAREIIGARIYDRYDPLKYERTYSIARSIVVDSEGGKPEEGTGRSLYSDPEIAPAKKIPDVSYLVFFEDPKYNTFISPLAKPVRKFFGAWEKLNETLAHRQAQDAVRKAISNLMPPTIRVG